MAQDTRLDHVASTLENLSRTWEAQGREGDAEASSSGPAFSIALTREAGTLGTMVAREVGNRLGWQVYDHELLERVAQEMGVRTALLESMDERKQSWLLESVEAFLAMPGNSDWGPLITESAYVRHLIEAVLALGVHGECVVVGRGSVFILPAATTLRVRLVAPIKERVAVMSHKLGVSQREAARRIRAIDRQRADFVRDHFLKDPADPSQHDLVLNTARLPVATQTSIIVEALHQLQSGTSDHGSPVVLGKRTGLR